MQTCSGASIATAVGMIKGNMIANVPQDDPVANEIMAAKTKATAGNIQYGSPAWATAAI
jgi:hypothetical protein